MTDEEYEARIRDAGRQAGWSAALAVLVIGLLVLALIYWRMR